MCYWHCKCSRDQEVYGSIIAGSRNSGCCLLGSWRNSYELTRVTPPDQESTRPDAGSGTLPYRLPRSFKEGPRIPAQD